MFVWRIVIVVGFIDAVVFDLVVVFVVILVVGIFGVVYILFIDCFYFLFY